MSQRLDALKSKLPKGVLSVVRSYDSHPVSDLIREIKFEYYDGYTSPDSGLLLKNYKLLTRLACELSEQLIPYRRHETDLRLSWARTYTSETKTRIMCFPKWRFETLEENDYLPLWVKEEYIVQKQTEFKP